MTGDGGHRTKWRDSRVLFVDLDQNVVHAGAPNTQACGDEMGLAGSSVIQVPLAVQSHTPYAYPPPPLIVLAGDATQTNALRVELAAPPPH